MNLTLPLATWLGQSEAPGQVAGYGPLDAADSRALAHVLSTRAGTQWCLTLTGPDGRPVAHGCARDGPAGRPRRKSADRLSTRSRGQPNAGSHPGAWIVTMTPLTGGDCDHARETPAYQPTAALRHLVDIRHGTCVFPGCRRPAAQCDADHTLAYDHGGRTCLCNLAPLCRHHHRCKQAEGWQLEQPEPGVLVWHTPAGRTYTTATTVYPV